MNKVKSWILYGAKYTVYLAKFIFWNIKRIVLKYPIYAAIIGVIIVLLVAAILAAPSILKLVHAPRPIPMTAAPASSGFQFAASNKQTQFSALIGESKNNIPKVQATFAGGSSVDFVLTDLNQNISKPSQTGNKVIFKDVRTNVDLSYQTLTNGIKEEIIVKKKTEGNAFTFALNNFGAAPKKIAPQTYGSVFYDTKGNYAFHFSKPFAVDAKGARTDNVVLAIHKADTDPGYKATVIVNQKWLDDPARVYPITIDPTIVDSASSDFALGQSNRVKDTGSGASPNLTTYYQELPTDQNTISLYHFNTGACTTDGSGNTYTLTANGGMTCSTGGMFGYKASGFATTPISYSQATLMDTAIPSGTIEAWINPANLSATQTIFYADSANDTILTVGTSGQVNLKTSASTNLATPNNVIAVSTWTHVAATWTVAGHKIYINGVEQATDTNTTTHTSQDYTTYIGVGAGGNTLPLSGSIDELRISRIARTPEEIRLDAQRRPYSVYTSDVIDLAVVSAGWNSLSWTELGVATGNGETLKDATGLVAQWNFNATSGTVANNDAEGSSCGGTPANCDLTLSNFASTGSQDAAAGSGWTAANRRWGAGAIMLSSVATADSVGVNNPANNALDPNSADMTIEMWVKTNDVTAELLSNNSGNGVACTSNGYYLGIDASGYPIFYLDTNGATAGCDAQIANPTTKINDGKWHFLAVSVTRGTSAVMYLDGVNIGSDTSVTSYSAITAAGWVNIGYTNAFDGVIDSTRFYSRALGQNEIISNYQAGNTELQTRVGTTTDANDGSWEDWKPTTGETAIASMDSDAANWTKDYSRTPAYTKVLLHMDGADASTTFSDAAGNTWTTYNHAQIDTAQSELGGASGLFDGTDDYITTPSSGTMDFGTDDFTIDGWIRKNGTKAYPGIISTGTGTTGWTLSLGNSDNKLRFFTTSTNGLSTGTIPDLTWTHVAFVRSGNTGTFYINGTASGTLSLSGITVNGGGVPTTVGDRGTTTHGYWNGWIDELRVSKGIARWNTNFTPPAAPYTTGTTIGWANLYNEPDIKMEGSGSLQVTSGILKLDEATVGLWHLDETGGASAYIKDASDYANNGTPTNTTIVDGFLGKARSFNGSSDYIEMPDAPSLDLTGDGTIEAWIKTSVNQAQWFLCKSGNYCLGTNSTGAFFFIGASTQNNGGTSLLAGTWHHVAITEDNTTVTYYVDGAAAGTDTVGWGTTLSNTLRIGRDGGANYFSGTVDEVRISNVVRSTEEIAEDYRAGRNHYLNKTISSTDLFSATTLPFYVASDRQGTFMSATIGESAYANYVPDANTEGFWHLDEQSGSGKFLKDASGNGNNGFIGAGAPAYTQGVIGKARSFNGSSDYLSCTEASCGGIGKLDFGVPSSSPFTFQAWFQRNGIPASSEQLIAKRTAGGNVAGYSAVLMNTGGVQCKIADGTNTVQLNSATSTYGDNNWHLLTCVNNGTNFIGYIDGIMYGSGAVSGVTGSLDSSSDFLIGVNGGAASFFTGSIDEVRVDNIARTADQIRQAYEIGARTHNITIDFKAALDAGNLIADTNDLSFTIDATHYGANAMGSNLYLGDKIIVKENYNGDDYLAHGTVNSVNASTGAVTVAAWEAGSVVPSVGFTANATVFKWQREYFDVRGSRCTANTDADCDRYAITNLTLRFTDGSQGENVWLDDFRSNSGYLTTPGGSTITSSTGDEYIQYRIIQSSFDTDVSTSITSATIDYTQNIPNAPTIGTPTVSSASSIQWNFTGNGGGSGTTGYKLFDASGNWLQTNVTCTTTYCTETGLSTNTQYTRKVAAYNGSGNSVYSATATKYTLAVVPGVPTTSSPLATSIGVTPDPSTNPSNTQLAIYVETGATCDGSGGNYIAANGSSSGSAVWQTAAAWSTVTATGLNNETTQYAFCEKARNGDTVETAFGSTQNYNGGFTPISGNFTISQNTSVVTKRYVDGNNAARYVWGLDSGGTTINTSVLTLKSGGKLGYGSYLTAMANTTIVAGSIVFPDGPTNTGIWLPTDKTGQMKLGSDVPLWVLDADADGWAANNKVWYGAKPTPIANYRRLNAMTSMDRADCNDSVSDPTNACLVGNGGACTSDSMCLSGICGTDADADQLFSASAGHTGVCWATAYPYTDTNDAQYCPTGYDPGTCQKCVNGAIAYQTGSEDLFNDCSTNYTSCSGNTPIGGDGLCDGSGACHTTGGSGTPCKTACSGQTGGGCSAGSCVTLSGDCYILNQAGTGKMSCNARCALYNQTCLVIGRSGYGVAGSYLHYWQDGYGYSHCTASAGTCATVPSTTGTCSSHTADWTNCSCN